MSNLLEDIVEVDITLEHVDNPFLSTDDTSSGKEEGEVYVFGEKVKTYGPCGIQEDLQDCFDPDSIRVQIGGEEIEGFGAENTVSTTISDAAEGMNDLNRTVSGDKGQPPSEDGVDEEGVYRQEKESLKPECYNDEEIDGNKAFDILKGMMGG